MRSRRRIHPYVIPDLANRLGAYCAAKGVTESAAVERAIEEHLAGKEKDNEANLRRLDRLGALAARQQRNTEVLMESLAVVVEMWFGVVPERSQEERAAGLRLGRARFKTFVDIVSEKLAVGTRFVDDLAKAAAPSGAPATTAPTGSTTPVKPR